MFGLGIPELVWGGLILVVYFVPSLVAFFGKNKNTLGIFLLNLFLGWTLIGWVIALVWAVKK